VSVVISNDGETLVFLCNDVTVTTLEGRDGYSVDMTDGFAVGHSTGGTGRPNLVKSVRATCYRYVIEEVADVPDFGPEDVNASGAG
jgi:hypothetical protein